MIRLEPLSEQASQQMFDQLLALAMAGDPPPSDSGLDNDVINALVNVAVQRTAESAALARSVFNGS